MTATIFALATIALLLGILAIVVGFIGSPADETDKMPSTIQLRLRNLRTQLSPRRQLMILGGVVAGILAWIVTGWLIALIALPVAAVGLPMLLGKGNEAADIERLEALETWTRSLGGLTTASTLSLERVITASLGSAPAAITPQVNTLVARINARWATDAALQAFADDLKDSTADLVVLHLKLAARVRGGGLSAALSDLAEAVFDEVRVRRQIEADRAKPRTNVRLITLTTLGVLLVIPFIGQFMDPYRSPFGQLMLGVWLILYVIVLIWLKRITIGKPTPRLLDNPMQKRA